MNSEPLLPSCATLPDVSDDPLGRLLRRDDPALTAAVADLVQLVRTYPEGTLAGWNSFLDTSPVSD
jgi:FXSXX-COOH protein